MESDEIFGIPKNKLRKDITIPDELDGIPLSQTDKEFLAIDLSVAKLYPNSQFDAKNIIRMSRKFKFDNDLARCSGRKIDNEKI